MNKSNYFYGPDFSKDSEFNTFNDDPVLQNNFINTENINIAWKSKNEGKYKLDILCIVIEIRPSYQLDF